MIDPVVAIADALRRHVAERRDFVIIHSDQARNYYVQCANVDPDQEELFAEAVSDHWLEAPNLLGASGAAALVGLGWTEPGKESPNWHRVFRIEGENSYEVIARQLLETLRTVYGLDGNAVVIEIDDDDSH